MGLGHSYCMLRMYLAQVHRSFHLNTFPRLHDFLRDAVGVQMHHALKLFWFTDVSIRPYHFKGALLKKE